jgi:hypothetical protein
MTGRPTKKLTEQNLLDAVAGGCLATSKALARHLHRSEATVSPVLRRARRMGLLPESTAPMAQVSAAIELRTQQLDRIMDWAFATRRLADAAQLPLPPLPSMGADKDEAVVLGLDDA